MSKAMDKNVTKGRMPVVSMSNVSRNMFTAPAMIKSVKVLENTCSVLTLLRLLAFIMAFIILHSC